MMPYYDLVMFFFIYSFAGWNLETGFASIKKSKFINRGFLRGPLCPIYGFGTILIILFSKLLSKVVFNEFNLLLLNVFLAIILVTALEYITGLLLEKIFHSKWWDYSDNDFNFNGYICLKYSLLWGVLAFFLIQFVHPVLSQVILSIPVPSKVVMTSFLIIYILTDTIISVNETINLRKVILSYSNVSEYIFNERIIEYKRFFLAFPALMTLNSDIKNLIIDKMDKLKVTLKSRLL